MSVWKSFMSLTRPYTCLIVPRIEACLSSKNRNLHSSPAFQYESREKAIALKKARMGAEKERRDPTGGVTVRKEEMKPGVTFPSRETHASLVDGVRYDQLPIIHVRASKNNTMASCEKYDGGGISMASAGSIGFKTARKGTNVAAQAVGAALGDRLLRRGVNNVRILVKGIGVGRLPCIKGLQLAGVNIVSITDNTPVYNGKRPRKARRV